jgi:hypothetical protein
MALFTALAGARPGPICESNPDLPEAFADVVMWLLEKDPAGRPASAREVVAMIRAIERQPAGAATHRHPATSPVRPATTAAPCGARAGRLWPRLRLLAGLMLAVAAAVVAVGAVRVATAGGERHRQTGRPVSPAWSAIGVALVWLVPGSQPGSPGGHAAVVALLQLL